MKHALNITTTLILCGSMAQAYAQSPAACIPTPSCTSLGYTSTTSCTDGLKCPFGNYWNCTHINKITELTNKITEQTNKITELEKVIETSQSQGEICVIGSILYSDKSCYLNPQKGKTPIGIVVYVDGKGGGQAMALKSISNNPFCSIYSTPSTCYEDGIPFPCFQTVDLCSKLASGGIVSSTAKEDYASCKNSKKIMGYGDKNSFSGVWAAYNYTTEGTSKGDWCIPAAGIFTSIENNLNIINTGFSHVGGTQFTSYTKIWASTATENGEIFYSDFTQSYALNTSSSTAFKDFRPVIEF